MLLLYLLCLLLPVSTLADKQKYSCRKSTPCGCSGRVTFTKIVGGETVRRQSWGWMVSLTQYSNHTHFCGGSILSNSWILTAAHCVLGRNTSDVTIFAGSNNLQHTRQKRAVAHIFLHPHFNKHTYINDIALIQLSSPLSMKDHDLVKICLPPKTVVVYDSVSASEYPPVNSTLAAIGWGQTAEHDRILSKELQQVTLQGIAYERDSCQQLIHSKSRQFCAGVETGGKDTCEGDSGGPLMRFSSDRQWIIVGVTSAGYGCARADYAGIYTRVAFYLDWIDEVIYRNDLFGDPVVNADDIVDGKSVNSLRSNMHSHYHSFPVVFIVISTCLSLYLM